MKIKKSHFEFHDRVRNGILLLAIVLLILIAVTWLYPFSENKTSALTEQPELQKQLDSLKKVAQLKNKKEYKLKPFNPNFINDFRGDQLGISAIALDKVYEFRQKGLWINSTEQFQKVSGISDSLLDAVTPYFKFPQWKMAENMGKKQNTSMVKELPFKKKGDLNAITEAELQIKIGIPDFVAKKIIQYRKEIGGFRSDLQLKDIEYLYDSQRKKLNSQYTVKRKNDFKVIILKEATVKDLVSVPYFDFEMALTIYDYIQENSKKVKIEDLGKIEDFPIEKIERIALYLK